MKLALAILTGKTIRFLSRRLGLGVGSSFPGYIAHRIEPHILRKLAPGAFRTVVTGTNGKTTTSNMLASIYRSAGEGIRITHNSLGANLVGGITTSLLEKTTLGGYTAADYSIFETDEATVPRILEDLRPRVVAVTNLFRDQLDRFGEVEQLYRGFHRSFSHLPPGSTLVLNADDPLVSHLHEGLDCGVLHYGITGPEAGGGTHALPPDDGETADILNCIHCGARYEYGERYMAHLGRYHCPGCGRSRPQPQVYASRFNLRTGTATVEIGLAGEEQTLPLKLGMPALYNVYNCLAATAAARAAGMEPETIARGLRRHRPVFGRMESIPLSEGCELFIILVKNPAGFNEVLRVITAEDRPRKLLMIINDHQADGEDISWLWDVNFEILFRLPEVELLTSGLRGEDLALRLKYAGLGGRHIPDPGEALELALSELEEGETIHILPNYSALLELRRTLQSRGLVEDAWGDEAE